MMNHERVQGLDMKSLKKHPSLIPLFVIVGGGVLMGAAYMIRCATKNPDVSWNRKANPEPNEAYRAKQYKFYSPLTDYTGLESPAPKYKD
ncbi:cytochrome c oxidase subunit NDUFA4 [Culicoides brevitarsis]|uniref:cytochrome c oxidase subunit NDUFA4 n=1 Tax=Culicoides brevitarsis TaxID=469753 RepID=UPI00307B1A34